jgi:putative membrane protein
VYGTGSEPDARFSFANERTFLAWIRTSLALLAAGVALDALHLPDPEVVRHGLAMLLVLLGMLCAVAAWTRWAGAERAMRREEPLPSSWSIVVVTVGVLAVAIVLLVVGL